MNMKSTMVAAVLLAATPAVGYAADPRGHYAVEGTSFNSKAYSGDVTVEKTGETYKVTWKINGTIYVGTGLILGDDLTVTYKAGNNTGVAIYGHSQNGWAGIYTYTGGTSIGKERWSN